MKKVFFFIVFIFATANSFAQSTVYVSGYITSSGTYVQPHYRTSPNTTRNDNYSTIGNVNPYTGAVGTKPGDSYNSTSTSTYASPSYSGSSNYSTTDSTPSYSTSTYSSSSNYSTTPVYTGSRGGQYYINSNGNKTYISR